MKRPRQAIPRKKPLLLTERDEKILRAIYTYRYMTALDVAWLLFKPSSRTHVREILSALAGGADLQTHAYLCRFGLPSIGNAERVYTLGAKGRDILTQVMGLPVDWYYRPYKLRHLSFSHILHNLILTRFLVAVNAWTLQHSNFKLCEMRLSYELARAPANVILETKGKTVAVAVIPDAWLLFKRIDNGKHSPILLEIDRGMEYQQRFKQHVRSRIELIQSGEYSKWFGTQAVRIVYATTGQTTDYRDTRRETMRVWTKEVLKELGKENWADVFRFASLKYDEIYTLALFEKPVWYRLDSPTPVFLLAQ